MAGSGCGVFRCGRTRRRIGRGRNWPARAGEMFSSGLGRHCRRSRSQGWPAAPEKILNGRSERSERLVAHTTAPARLTSRYTPRIPPPRPTEPHLPPSPPRAGAALHCGPGEAPCTARLFSVAMTGGRARAYHADPCTAVPIMWSRRHLTRIGRLVRCRAGGRSWRRLLRVSSVGRLPMVGLRRRWRRGAAGPLSSRGCRRGRG